MPGSSKNTARHQTAGKGKAAPPPKPVNRIAVVVLAVVVVVITVIAADVIFGAVTNGSGSGSSAAPQGQWVEQGRGGSWTDVSADRLAEMLEAKDFTFVNVKTPYIGEIAQTDLYIPYDQIASRVSELPAAKGARILVYCRSGAESRVAAQTLLDLGYTNVWNLDKGMNGWTASGRSLIQVAR
jgi:rhodanese-related sulfurtransferase